MQHSAGQEGAERLNPSISNPNWLILRRRRALFETWFKELPDQALRILDVGGRIQPYRPLLNGKLGQYVALDLRRTPLVDIVANAEQLPLPDGHFDLALCTQVLEYVSDPRMVIAEIYRVLKKDGVLLLSVPAIFPRDSDPEYWRFLPASLKMLLRRFHKVEIFPEVYSIAGVLRTLNVFLASSPSAALRMLLRFTLIPTFNVAGAVLESVALSRNDQFTANFSALAQK